jgi:surfeit locus 1 family protein
MKDGARAAARGKTRLGFWPVFWVLLGVTLSFGLGLWQLERLEWKRALLAEMDRQLASAPVALPARIDDPAAWNYRPVTLNGVFAHDRTLILMSRIREGKNGVHLLTPLLRDGAPPVIVNRGWVPLDKQDPALRPETLIAGPVSVSGIARTPNPRGWMQPDNVPAANQWYWSDLAAMAQAIGLGPLAPVIVEAGPNDDADSLPIGGQTRLAIPNDHLEYAITWFSLGLVLLTIFGVYLRRRR